MPVKLIIEADTPGELRPYLDALATLRAEPVVASCSTCTGTGRVVDHDGVTHHCPACRGKVLDALAKAVAPCECCKGKRYVDVPQYDGMIQVRCPYCNPDATTMDYRVMHEAKA